MKKCDYCGRYLKNSHDTCPGCGGTHFQEIRNFGTKKIIEVPKGGYKMTYSMKKYLRSFKNSKAALITLGTLITGIGFVVNILVPLIIAKGNSFDSSLYPFFVPIYVPVIGIIFIFIGLYSNRKYYHERRKIKKILRKGILIKNMPYKFVISKTNNKYNQYYVIEVQYEKDNGEQI